MADTTDKNAGSVGQDLFVSLTDDAEFLLPDINLGDADYQFPSKDDNPLYAGITELSNGDLTTGIVGGTGTFDALMASVGAHLKVEFEKNRITGKDYTDAYVQVMANALNTATQFLLGKDQAYWQAILAQSQARRAEIEAVTARVQLDIAKAQLAASRYEAFNAKAQYALTKMQIANADAQYNLLNKQIETAVVDKDIKVYQLGTALPLETQVTQMQLVKLTTEKDIEAYNLSQMMPLQKAALTAQNTQIAAQTTLLGTQNNNVQADTAQKQFQTSYLLPAQTDKVNAEAAAQEYTNANLLPQQKNLLVEQTESARADTLTTRLSDGSLITGTKGKQRDLYEEQVTSYKRDAEAKVARIFADMWITRKTLDEGLTPPTSMADANYNSVLDGLRQKVGF